MTATAAEVGIIIALAVLLDGVRFAINALLFAGAPIWALRLSEILP